MAPFFMTCYHPITAYWSRTLKTKLGTPAITFKYADCDPELGEFQIPCGQCIGCRLDRSLDSAVRAHHESLLYDRNYFLTLTYTNDSGFLTQHQSLDDYAKKSDLIEEAVDLIS